MVEATLTAEHEQHVGCNDADHFSHEPIPDAVAIDSVAVGGVFAACGVNFEFCELACAPRAMKKARILADPRLALVAGGRG